MAGLPESLESQNLMNCNEEGLRNSGEETIQVCGTRSTSFWVHFLEFLTYNFDIFR